jgi:hypothetical protein
MYNIYHHKTETLSVTLLIAMLLSMFIKIAWTLCSYLSLLGTSK